MTPTNFPETNVTFTAPEDLDESQVGSIPAHHGIIEQGSLAAHPIVVTAWRPTPEELEEIIMGNPIYVTTLGQRIPPQMLTTNFKAAVSPP